MATGRLNITSVKLGDSADPAKNFIISTPAVPDGTLTIERENGTDVLVIDANGKVSFPGGTDNLGIGQVWNNVTGARSFGVTYTNTTGKPIQVIVQATNNVNIFWGYIVATVGGVALPKSAAVNNQSQAYLSFVVPVGATYVVTTTGTTLVLVDWAELR